MASDFRILDYLTVGLMKQASEKRTFLSRSILGMVDGSAMPIT
jgi:hypothetical protein